MVCQGYRNCWTCERNSNFFVCWPAGKGRDVEMQQLKWREAVVWVWSLISLNKLHKTNFEWTILKMFKCGWFVSLYKWAFKHTHTLQHLYHLEIFSIDLNLLQVCHPLPKLRRKAAASFVRLCVCPEFLPSPPTHWKDVTAGGGRKCGDSCRPTLPSLLFLRYLLLYDVALNVAASLSITAEDELMSCLRIVKREQ